MFNGTDQTDIAYGLGGDDVLNGEKDADQPFGGGGNDVMDGGSGNDADPAGDTLSVTGFTQASNGTVVDNGDSTDQPDVMNPLDDPSVDVARAASEAIQDTSVDPIPMHGAAPGSPEAMYEAKEIIELNTV